MKIFIDDDDDDVVERTRTGPSAVRSDLEHQVTVTMMLKYSFLTRFQLIRRRRANRCGQDEVFGRAIIIHGKIGGYRLQETARSINIHIYIQNSQKSTSNLGIANVDIREIQ